MTRYLTATVLGLSLAGSALGVAAGPAAASGDDERSAYIERTCERTLGNPAGDVLESSTVPAADTEVAPGDVIRVTLTWDDDTWPDSVLHKVIDCVTVNRKYRPDLSVEEKPTDNDGVFETAITVPKDSKDGDEICEQGFISGGRDGSQQENSEQTCFPVKGKASAPTAPPPAGEDNRESPPPSASASPSPAPCPECAATPVTAEAPPSALPQSTLPPGPAPPAPTAAPAAPPVVPAPQVLGAQESPATLPVTGTSRSLQLAGALALMMGGWAVAGGARRRSGTAARASQN